MLSFPPVDRKPSQPSVGAQRQSLIYWLRNGLGAAVYLVIVGCVCKGSHLARYGVPAWDTPTSALVATGLLVAWCFFFPSVLLYLLARMVMDSRRDFRTSHRFRVVTRKERYLRIGSRVKLLVSSGLFLLVLLGMFVGATLLGYLIGEIDGFSFAVYTLYIPFVVAVGIMVDRFAPIGVGTSELRETENRLGLGVGLLLLSFVYVAIFSNTIYPRVPYTLGGGRPREVIFRVDTVHLESLKELGLPFQANAHLTAPVQILHEGLSDLYLTLPDGGIAKVDKQRLPTFVLHKR